jgi:hypothetical protein
MNDFIQRFEAALLTKEEWTHTAHLQVAYHFIWSYPPEEAGQRLREGIKQLNLALGGRNTDTEGFHETLTEFWIREVRALGPDNLAAVLALPSSLWRRDYPYDLPGDREARRTYVPPPNPIG